MKKLKIGFASTDWSKSIFTKEGPSPGGANYVRIQQNRPYLGINSVTGLLVYNKDKGFGIIDWFQNTHYDCKIIVLQRLMFADLVNKIVDRHKYGQIIINDIDDWYWGLHEENHAYKLTHPDHNKEENTDHYRNIIQQSDGVTVSTPFLYDKMVKDFGCKNVQIIENCVTVQNFKYRYANLKKPIVGWVGSTSHRSGDLEILQGVLKPNQYKIHHSGHVNGAAWFADKVGLPRDKVMKTPMHNPIEYAKHSFCFDVGLAPLNDVPFNHAKSWIKAIEYAAAGIPFIASNLSEYKRLNQTYGLGHLASTPEEWQSHLNELLNTQKRSGEGKRGHMIVKENLDVRHMSAKWAQVLKSFV
jgi:glycosyltransferase involved in cell wall biosynthesis